jgi:hypothetical protein
MHMQRILQSEPDKLDELFSAYFTTVSVEDRQKTLNLMQWILFAERPLAPMEVNCALAQCRMSVQIANGLARIR